MVRRQRQRHPGESRLLVVPQDNFTAAADFQPVNSTTEVCQTQTTVLSGLQPPLQVTGMVATTRQDNGSAAACFQQHRSSTELHEAPTLGRSATVPLEPDTTTTPDDNSDAGFQQLELLTELHETERTDLSWVSDAVSKVFDTAASFEPGDESTDDCSVEDDDDDNDNNNCTVDSTDDSTVYPSPTHHSTCTEDSTDDSTDDYTDDSTSADSTEDCSDTSTCDDDNCDYRCMYVLAANSSDTGSYDDDSTVVDDEDWAEWSDGSDDWINPDEDP